MGLYHTLRLADRSPMRVSACWIVKDGEEDIGYSMESVGEAADELIVVDTGSTDRTVEIAREHTDRVYLYPWRNDFAAAKNFALTKASGDWIIFLDADEYFAKESTEHLRPLLEEAFQSPVPASYLMDLYNVRRGYEDQPGSKLPVTRIFRMLPGSGYQEAVHENLRRYPWVPLAVDAPKEIFLYHTGYIPERMKAKEARNIALLKEAEEKGRASRLTHYYLAGLHFTGKEYEKAIQEAKLSIEAGEKPLYHAFAVYHNWYLSLEALGQDTTEAMEAGLEAFPDMPDFHAVKGLLLKEEGKLEEAKAELEKALYLCEHHDELLPHEENRLAESGEIEKVKEALKELA